MNEKSVYSQATSRRRNFFLGGVLAIGGGALLLKVGSAHDSLPTTLTGLATVGGGLIGEVCSLVLDKDITDAETSMRGTSRPFF